MKYNHTEYKKAWPKQAEKADDMKTQDMRGHVDWAKARIASLDRRLGTDIGAKKERKRLNAIINHK